MAELAASARCAKSADKMDGASSIKTQFSPRFRGNSSTQKLMDRTSLGRAVTSSCLCKNAEGAGFPFQVEALEDGMDDPVHALNDVHKAHGCIVAECKQTYEAAGWFSRSFATRVLSIPTNLGLVVG